jgi:hypothetical protein
MRRKRCIDMKIGKLNLHDIDYIMSYISLSSTFELSILGKTMNETRNDFIKHIDKEFTGIFYNDDMKPEAMIILELKGLNRWCVNLITISGAWERIGISLTKFFIKISDDLSQRSGGLIEAYSPFNYGKYFSWFDTMGFKLDNTNYNGTYRYFKQVR